MSLIASVACVAAAVWIVLLPPPATRRLTVTLRRAHRSGGSPPTPAHGLAHAYGRGAVFGRPRAQGRPPGEWPWGAPPWWARGSATLARALERTPWRSRRTVAARRTAVIELCDGITAELTAGRPPDAALVHSAGVLPSLPALAAAVAAAREAGDVANALDRAARTPGCDALRLLAGCWRVGVDRGGMLAAVIEGLADALRDEQAHREDVALQLAGPRATARLLAGLPLLGLAMAVALGAHPMIFLLGTLPGAGCLLLGLSLDALGLWWTHRLAAAAEETR